MNKRIEIEEAENGYVVTVYPGRKSDEAYPEPVRSVARDDNEVLELVEGALG